jgi:hypothetical protein
VLRDGKLEMLILHAYASHGIKQLMAASEALDQAGFCCRFDQNFNLHNPASAVALCAEMPGMEVSA